jgi:hypothetical protein
MVEIEKGVPIPSTARILQGRKQMYPFRQMEPGDSIVVTKAEWSKALPAMRAAAKAMGCRFVWDYEDKENPNNRILDSSKIRIWRCYDSPTQEQV